MFCFVFSVEKDDSVLKIFIQEFSFRDILKIEDILGWYFIHTVNRSAVHNSHL